MIIILINCTCHPIFFDIFQKSTTESVISDYRQNKRADSNSEHHHDDNNEEMKKKNHVEFYAEIIGKLIGSVRSGIRNFIDDVKKGRSMKASDMNATLIMENLENFLTNDNSTMSNSGGSESSNIQVGTDIM